MSPLPAHDGRTDILVGIMAISNQFTCITDIVFRGDLEATLEKIRWEGRDSGSEVGVGSEKNIVQVFNNPRGDAVRDFNGNARLSRVSADARDARCVFFGIPTRRESECPVKALTTSLWLLRDFGTRSEPSSTASRRDFITRGNLLQ